MMLTQQEKWSSQSQLTYNMNKQKGVTPKNQMFVLNASQLQFCKITKEAQSQIKGGSIIIEDDMVI